MVLPGIVFGHDQLMGLVNGLPSKAKAAYKRKNKEIHIMILLNHPISRCIYIWMGKAFVVVSMIE